MTELSARTFLFRSLYLFLLFISSSSSVPSFGAEGIFAIASLCLLRRLGFVGVHGVRATPMCNKFSKISSVPNHQLLRLSPATNSMYIEAILRRFSWRGSDSNELHVCGANERREQRIDRGYCVNLFCKMLPRHSFSQQTIPLSCGCIENNDIRNENEQMSWCSLPIRGDCGCLALPHLSRLAERERYSL